MNWTDERVEKLKRLWSEGLSASQIAAQLGGVSRNAVIGKVHRLNMPGRAKSGGTPGPVRTSAPVKKPAPAPRAAGFAPRSASRPANTSSASVAIKPDMDVAAYDEANYRPVTHMNMPESRRLILTELTERTCKWPVGDPLKDDFHFCGCESPDNSPYCTYHGKLAYQPVHERRKPAARA